MSRKLSERRLRLGPVQIYIEWRDVWVGAYVAPAAVYILPLPFLVVRIARRQIESETTRWSRGTMRAEDVDPQTLVDSLTRSGWRLTGRGLGYVRLGWPGEHPLRGRSLAVPTDPAAPEHPELMRGVLLELMDAAETGREADAVLTAVATRRQVDVPRPSQLDKAMSSVWLHGDWKWLTRNMTTEEREEAVAAVLRVDRWTKQEEPEESLLGRESLAWWDN